MKKGIVKWFDPKKGFGFISVEKDHEDIFVHYSAIKSNGKKSLKEGEIVQFKILDSDKGPLAKDVIKL
ncbi:MAG: cold-shock protein [Bacillota bacterium]